MAIRTRAKWIKHEHLFRKTEYECSHCRARVNSPAAFCPACGAEMRRGRTEPDWIEEMEFYDA